MRSIEVVIEKDSCLSRDIWRFLYFDREHWLRLDSFSRDSRTTLRHKYRIIETWQRLFPRESNIDRPQVPEYIALRARELFCADLGVDLDSE